MILGIVKQAVQIKTQAQTESALISEGEYCYACALALKKLSASEEQMQELKQAETVEALREAMKPYFKEKRESCQKDRVMTRLLNLLLHCRVEGEITDEVRELMNEI